jgi:hypothetical protein
MRKIMLFLAVFGLVASLWAADPFVGTWKMNVAKSNANPTPKSQTLKIAAQDGGFKWAFDTIEADGKATGGVWSGKYDGKDYSLTENTDFDTVATKKINANTLDSVMKKGGKVVGAGREVVSKDGKTLTLTSKLTNAQGQSVSVYDKQ